MATISFTTNGNAVQVPVLTNGKIPVEYLPDGVGRVLNSVCNEVSRSVNTRYNNTTGFPMIVHVLLSYNGTSSASSIRVGNTQSATVSATFESVAIAATHSQPMYAVVPAGGWYQIGNSSGHNMVRTIECTQFYV